jgi:phosphonopyruvate decarboxylase
MINTKNFGNELKRLGFTFFSGVPCSFLKNLINYAINECDYVAAANEGDAIAIASGAYMGGKKSVVLMQNSGLTNAVSPLTSLNYPFKFPLLGFVSLRGEPGIQDEPQHELMGQITTQLLDLMKIEWAYLPDNFEEAKQMLTGANRCIEQNRSFFFVVKKGTFEIEDLQKRQDFVRLNQMKVVHRAENEMPTRYETLSVINAFKDNKTVQLATTGKTGRELYEIEDSDNNFYMVGSMGCIGSFGLGLALTKPDKDIVVIDGDGSLLMRMGSLATNGYYHPTNLIHILLDNNTHDSTGGQSTVSHNTHFVEIAASCGYASSIYVHNLEELRASLREWKNTKGLTFLYMKIAKGSKEHLGRPKIKPHEVKERLRYFLGQHPPVKKEDEEECGQSKG